MLFQFVLMSALVAVEYPPFNPPSSGVGSEALPMTVRAAGMGGVSTGLLSSDGLSMSNPAASAWTTSSGVTWSAGWRTGDDDAWDGRMRFPSFSMVFPLPFRVVLAAGMSERSRLLETGDVLTDEFSGVDEWDGGLNEACVAATIRLSDWFALSLGSRGTFGNVRSDVSLQPLDPDSGFVSLNTDYIDEASFEPSWGLQAGAFMRTSYFDVGASILTDRQGRLTINRDYASPLEESSGENYSLPGEANLGIVARPLHWLSLGADLHSRKVLHLLESSVPDGTITGLGAEATLGSGFSARAGWSRTDGLWRDGAVKLTSGLGYRFAGGAAGIDLAVSRETWEDQGETAVFVSLWSSERWLGIP